MSRQVQNEADDAKEQVLLYFVQTKADRSFPNLPDLNRHLVDEFQKQYSTHQVNREI